MSWTLFIQIASTFAIAVVGGWLGHRLSAARDLANERRRLVLSYLLEAYRALELAHDPRDKDSSQASIEQAISDIQLFGSTEQVEMAHAFAKDMTDTGRAALNPLVHELRKTLREQLKLPLVTSTILRLRFTKDAG